MEELCIGRLGDPGVALHRGERLGHPVEMRGACADRRPKIRGGHECLVEVGLLGEQPEGQSALPVDLAAVGLVTSSGEPEECRLARPVRSDQPDPIAERDRGIDRIEDHERADLAAHSRQPEDAHRIGPVPDDEPVAAGAAVESVAAAEARAAARRVAAARFVRSVRARVAAAAASSRVNPTVPSPASCVQRPPVRRGPPVMPRRIEAAPFRSAAPSRWHHEQKCVDRAPMTMRLIGRPQRGQGSPVRW